MGTRGAANTAITKLYAGLSGVERVRLLAKLSKAHDAAGTDRLRRATPVEHAAACNRALGLLRTLNGHVIDWIVVCHVAMERDRFRAQHAVSEAAQRRLAVHALGELWRLVPYPVTESEHRAMVAVERAEPVCVRDYAEELFDAQPLRPELRAIVDEYRRADEPGDAERESFWRGYADRVAAAVRAAIKRGELPKPTPAPKGAANPERGDIWLPSGVLADWAAGAVGEAPTTIYPGAAVPLVGEVFGGDFAAWEIRPDAEAADVAARRALIRSAFLAVRATWGEQDIVPALDPPLTPKARADADRRAAEVHDELDAGRDLAPLVLDGATTRGGHRAQLEDIRDAVEAIRVEDFGGEDPLWPEVRDKLDRALTEAGRFAEPWASAHVVMRSALREAVGLEAFPMNAWNAETKAFAIPPVPLPEGEHDLAGTVELIRAWAA